MAASDNEYELPEQIVESASSSTSGWAKRRRKSALPRVFLLFEKTSQVVSGAFLVTECAVLPATPTVLYWKSDGLAILDEPVSLAPGDISWRGGFGKLSPEVEIRIRHGASTVGGCINDHFIDFAGSQWVCWQVADDMLQTLASARGGPVTFTSAKELSSIVSIVPEIVRHSRIRLWNTCLCSHWGIHRQPLMSFFSNT